jgi:hypothetical protein
MRRDSQSTLTSLRQTEERLAARVAELEAKILLQLRQLQDDAEASGREWLWPMLGLGGIAIALAVGWAVTWARVKKLHYS